MAILSGEVILSSRSSGVAKDLARIASASREIPRPAEENAGLRDDCHAIELAYAR